MIPRGVEVFVGLEPIDLRWSFDRLSGVVMEKLGRDVRGGALFVFFGKRHAAVKAIFFDGNGLCLFYKRLDRGTFKLPEPRDEGELTVVLEERELDDLLEGLALETPEKKVRARIH
ncbi:MAG: IS66 family insertion sequence element accessory protein TnpB [Myxococcaceae bacterium]